MNGKNVLRPLGLIFGLLVLLGAGTQPVLACTCYCDSICGALGDCCSNCATEALTAGQVQVTPLGNGLARITLDSTETMAMAAGLSCVAGFQQIPGVRSIDALSVVNAVTGESIYSFFPNEISGRSLEDLAADVRHSNPQAAAWYGFQVKLPASIAPGIPTRFVIDVTMSRGVNAFTLASLLRSKGLFAGGSGNPDGSLDFHHYFVRELKDFDIQVTAPARRPSPERLQ